MSLVTLLLRAGKLKCDTIFWHYPHTTPVGAIRAGDWNLIEYFDDSHVKLYHLRDDISESQDLAQRLPDKAKELHQRLVSWRKQVGARMPTPNPEYDASKADQWKRRPR